MPILDSRKLLAFATLAQTGSFTLAAEDLGLTQSAVSHSIKALENELNVRLVDRRGRAIRLTAVGKRLLNYANRILADMEEARADLAGYVSVET
ncbi:MAG: LysR family transcriptional regulator [Opitutaceae bacterium]|nr:LysR family transcriptional regulator [Opitutaceae bacterium]